VDGTEAGPVTVTAGTEAGTEDTRVMVAGTEETRGMEAGTEDTRGTEADTEATKGMVAGTERPLKGTAATRDTDVTSKVI